MIPLLAAAAARAAPMLAARTGGATAAHAAKSAALRAGAGGIEGEEGLRAGNRSAWEQSGKSATERMNKVYDDAPGAGPDKAQQFGQGIMDKIKAKTIGKLEGMLNDKIDMLLDPVGSAFNAGSKMANRGRQVIQDDYVGLFSELLPEAGQKFVKELQALTNAIVSRGRELSGWSGQLASTVAQADIRTMRSEQFEARVAGPEYARTIDAESRLFNSLRDDFAPTKAGIASIAADILEGVNNLKQLLPLREVAFLFGEMLRYVGKIVTFDVDGIGKLLETLPQRMRDAFTASNQDGFSAMIQRSLDEINRDIRNEAGRAQPQFGNGRFNFPVVNGL